MSQTIALFFPGQGSQAVGMGQALAERHIEARRVFEEADEVLGFSLSRMCFEGPEQELVRTANTQPAILTCSVAAWTVLRARHAVEPAMCLGHSLGEFSALVVASALEFADAVRLVRLRGQAMQEAVPEGVGAMAAVIGLDTAEVEAVCEAAAEGQVLSLANENGGGQIVIAGHADAVGRAVALVKERKARGIPLRVSAPFHCALMQPAADRLAEALETVTVGDMSCPVITNVEGEPNQDAARVKELLVRQVTARVRWEASVRTAVRMGATKGLEVGHGTVLAGLARRMRAGLKLESVGSPDDIDVLNVPA